MIHTILTKRNNSNVSQFHWRQQNDNQNISVLSQPPLALYQEGIRYQLQQGRYVHMASLDTQKAYDMTRLKVLSIKLYIAGAHGHLWVTSLQACTDMFSGVYVNTFQG